MRDWQGNVRTRKHIEDDIAEICERSLERAIGKTARRGKIGWDRDAKFAGADVHVRPRGTRPATLVGTGECIVAGVQSGTAGKQGMS